MSKRLFLAIPIPQPFKDLVYERIGSLQLPVKWISSEKFHITVHFFGSVEEEALHSIYHALEKSTADPSSFTLRARTIHLKPGRGYQMIWVGFEKSPDYEHLARGVADTLTVKLTRTPLPHINLTRHKGKIKTSDLPLEINYSLPVTTLELWESKLSPKGSTYSSLRSFTLKDRT